MAWLRVLIILLILVPSCAVRHRVVTTGAEIHRELPDLLETGEATVLAKDSTSDKTAEVRVRVRSDQKVIVDAEPVAVSELLRDCPIIPRFAADGEPLTSCGLLDYRYRPIELRSYEKRSVGEFATTALVLTLLGTFVGTGVCTFACDGDSTIQDASLVTFTTIGIGTLLGLIINCSGRWGQPGCRD